jgi:hypothetical protein
MSLLDDNVSVESAILEPPNIVSMINQLNQEEEALLSQGIPSIFLVYVVKNWPSGHESDDRLGDYFYSKADALRIIKEYGAEFSQLIYDCRVVDGRNVQTLIDMLAWFDATEHAQLLELQQFANLSVSTE